MRLRGQEPGYAMAALLVAMSVMSIVAAGAMPVWRHMSQREKEAELIFRGQQYARAIGLFQRRAGPGVNPPNLDVLIQQRFLRKKYKDPITGEDFDLISPLSNAAATPGGVPGSAATANPGSGFQTAVTPTGRGGTSSVSRAGGGAAPGGIIGVASKSKEKSIRIYNGRNYYNEWQFIFVPQQQAIGRGATPPGARGQRGVPPQFGQPGQFPGRAGPGGIGGRAPQSPFERGAPPGGPGRGQLPQPQRPPGD